MRPGAVDGVAATRTSIVPAAIGVWVLAGGALAVDLGAGVAGAAGLVVAAGVVVDGLGEADGLEQLITTDRKTIRLAPHDIQMDFDPYNFMFYPPGGRRIL